MRILCCRGTYWLGSFAFKARGGGHPGGGVFRLEVDDSAIMGVENPADGGRRGTGRAGFGQGDGLPKAKAFKLTADLVGVLNGFMGAHFTAAAGAFQGIAAPDREDTLAPAALVSGGRLGKFEG